MNIAVVTLSTPNLDEYNKYAIPSKERYCAKHGYKFHYYKDIIDPDRHPVWSKLLAIREVIEATDCDWVFWTDADAVIIDDTVRLEQFLVNTDNIDLIVSAEPYAPNTFSVFQASHFFIRNCQLSLDFLAEAYTRIDAEPLDLREQSAMQEVLREWYDLSVRTRWVPDYAFNTHPIHTKHGAFIRHYGGDYNATHLDTLRAEMAILQNRRSFKYVEDLPDILHYYRVFGTGAVVGERDGEYSEHLLDNWWGTKLYSIITTGDIDMYPDVCGRLRKFHSWIDIRMRPHDIALAGFDSGSLDFVYLADAVPSDDFEVRISSWLSKVRDGGILAGSMRGSNVHRRRSMLRMVAQFSGLNIVMTSRDADLGWYIVKE